MLLFRDGPERSADSPNGSARVVDAPLPPAPCPSEQQGPWLCLPPAPVSSKAPGFACSLPGRSRQEPQGSITSWLAKRMSRENMAASQSHPSLTSMLWASFSRVGRWLAWKW